MENGITTRPLPKPSQRDTASSCNYPARITQAEHEQKIAELRYPDAVKQALHKIMFLISMPKADYPDPNEMAALVSYVITNHGRFSVQSLTLAFELFIAGKLDQQPERFIKFGPLLIEQVMQSYTRYSFNIIHKAPEIEASGDNPELDAMRQMTDDQKDEILKSNLVKVFNEYKSNGKLWDPGNYLWRFLERKGFVNFTVERKQRILDRCKELNRDYLRSKKDTSDEKTEKLKCASREMALREFFDDLIQSETELSEIFETK